MRHLRPQSPVAMPHSQLMFDTRRVSVPFCPRVLARLTAPLSGIVRSFICITVATIGAITATAQAPNVEFPPLTPPNAPIPKCYFGLDYDTEGYLRFTDPEGGSPELEVCLPPQYTLHQFRHAARATEAGLAFDFNASDLDGTLYYGFIDDEAPYPQPVWFKKPARIQAGKAEVNILKNLRGKYDMVGWERTGRARFGYRVMREDGLILYDGKLNLKVLLDPNGPTFLLDDGIAEGPFLHQVTDTSALLVMTMTHRASVTVELGLLQEMMLRPAVRHEIPLTGLSPDTEYTYTLRYGNSLETHRFRTALAPNAPKPFTFAYCSDSRNGQGGGERHIYGVNAYIMKKIFALAAQENARFVQFTGDLIDGYLLHKEQQRLQYANWKRAVEPFCAGLPFYAGFGNHEALVSLFAGRDGAVTFDRFPFDTASAEALFREEFANPHNGPRSEDGSIYDPSPGTFDFPDYDETCFHYRYGNVAMISLNSDYWYAPYVHERPGAGGNPHGYLMDRQLEWLQRTLAQFEADETIDHVFVTQHTPAFPNGGHASDDMWYNGDNTPRPIIAGKPVDVGIIERRDQYLDLLVNESSKVRAILTGDEHNYNRLLLTNEVNIYPDDWAGERFRFSRPIWQINNGAAGAPYYAQEELPWSDDVSIFSTQHALCFFHVDGASLKMTVKNPDTLAEIDELDLTP